MILGNIVSSSLSPLYLLLLSFPKPPGVFALCADAALPSRKEKPGPGAAPQAEPREQRTEEGQGGEHAGSKLEGKAFAFSLCPPKAWRYCCFLLEVECGPGGDTGAHCLCQFPVEEKS